LMLPFGENLASLLSSRVPVDQVDLTHRVTVSIRRPSARMAHAAAEGTCTSLVSSVMQAQPAPLLPPLC
jgi:hypothetical protein